MCLGEIVTSFLRHPMSLFHAPLEPALLPCAILLHVLGFALLECPSIPAIVGIDLSLDRLSDEVADSDVGHSHSGLTRRLPGSLRFFLVGLLGYPLNELKEEWGGDDGHALPSLLGEGKRHRRFLC